MVERIGLLFSEAFRSRVYRRLREADLPFTAESYLGISLLLSLLVGMLTSLVDPLLGIILFLAVFGVFLYVPVVMGSVRGRIAEWELPFFLKSFVTLVKSGIDPIKSLEIASKGRRYIQQSISRILTLHSNGTPLSRAFEVEASTYTSPTVRKTLEILPDVIEGGTGIEALDRLSESLILSKKIDMREFSSKLSLYTLMFLAVTALVPSILIIYTYLMPLIFETPHDPTLLYFALYIILPFTTIFMLLYLVKRW